MRLKRPIQLLLFAVLLCANHSIINAQCITDSIPPIAICDVHIDWNSDPDLPIIIGAFTFDDGSTDNCTDTFDLQFYASTDLTLTAPPTTTFLMFPAGTTGLDTVGFWVVDSTGNFNVCYSTIAINISTCANDTISPIADCQDPLFINLGPTDSFSVTPDIL